MTPVQFQEDLMQDGFGAVLEEGGATVVVAVMHAGTAAACERAERICEEIQSLALQGALPSLSGDVY